MKRKLSSAMVLLAAALLNGCGAAGDDSPREPLTLVISAASDLQLVFQEIAAEFERETGLRVVLNFGASGQLAQQVAQGAPVDVFASADAGYVDELEAEGLIVPDTRLVYGRGRLALWSRADARVRVQRIEDLTRPSIRRIAIANPEHAPYGVAAREALQNAGIWEAIQPKLVLGEDVRQAMQYAETGNVDVALVAYALTIEMGGHTVEVPDSLYQPLEQTLAVVQDPPHEAEAYLFVEWLQQSPVAREVLHRYGFGTGEEELIP